MILLAAFLLILVREPAFLISPRIWAEEGSIYIQSYIDMGFLSSILQPHLGYYSLFSNLTSSLSATILGLEWSAYGTTYLSLAVNLVCITAPLYLPSSYWKTKLTQALLVFSALLVSSAEIWLNSINVHFYLGLYGCYLLLSDFGSMTAKSRYFHNAFILLGSLTSVTTVILLPFFLVRAFLKHKKRQKILSLQYAVTSSIIFCGLVVQLSAFVSSFAETGNRLSMYQLQHLPEGFLRTSIYLVQGNSFTVTAIFGVLAILFGTWSILRTRRGLFIAILAFYVSLVFSVLSIDMVGGGRYGFIPSMLMLLYFINSVKIDDKLYSTLILAICPLFLIYKMNFYFDTELFYDLDWISFAEEYSNAIANKSTYVRVFPHWEGTDWRILLN